MSELPWWVAGREAIVAAAEPSDWRGEVPEYHLSREHMSAERTYQFAPDSLEAIVERVEPEHLLSYRWHPYPVEPKIDYEKEQRTVVTFTLKDAGNGTLLTVVESGFDKVPLERRNEAFRMNSNGWEAQLENIQRYVTTQ